MIGIVDSGVVLVANLFNLLIVGIMLSRPFGKKRLEYYLGFAVVALSLPLFATVVLNLMQQREWWMVVLPGLLMIFSLLEWLFDYVLKFPFRQTRWLGPYLFLFYLSQWGMIGYAFATAKSYGFVTLLSYFLSLGATAYSYSRVGHGG